MTRSNSDLHSAMDSNPVTVHLTLLGKPLGVVSFPFVLPVGSELDVAGKKLKIQRYQAAVIKNTRRSGCDQVTTVEAVMEKA